MFGLAKKEDLQMMQDLGISEKQVTMIAKSVIHHVVEQLKQNDEDTKSYLKELSEKSEQHQKETQNRLRTIDNKVEGEYVTPQDIDAIKMVVKDRATFIIQKHGVQLSLDTFTDARTMSPQEQAQAYKKAQEQFNRDIGKIKSKIMVSLKKYLGMKGNAPNNHIKRKDVDRCVQYVKELKAKDIQI